MSTSGVSMSINLGSMSTSGTSMSTHPNSMSIRPETDTFLSINTKKPHSQLSVGNQKG